MNENLDLVEILKDCPEGTKLYSTILGDVRFAFINNRDKFHPIIVKVDNNRSYSFSANGKMYFEYKGECTLFPSREQRDWSKFKVNKPKFDPKTLQPFDKVLVREANTRHWRCDFFSHIKKDDNAIYPYLCVGASYRYSIPYNDDTKHLVGTTEEAPEFYRCWEI